jgi:outer membrane receptor protein involved in Fe transport
MRKISLISIFCVTLAAFLLAPSGWAQTNTDQADASADQEETDIEEVIVTGSQIRGAAISDALSVSVISSEDIEVLGIESGDELLDAMPEQGQNFFNEAENISGGVNSARVDIGAFNLRNIGTVDTLVLMSTP